MKQSILSKIVILACSLAFATAAFASPGKTKANYSGIIDSYNAATKTLTVKHGDKEGVFVIANTAEVRQGGTKADASALTAGQKVKVEFVLDGATKIAQKVELSGAATKK